jgi:hypothetical protein
MRTHLSSCICCLPSSRLSLLRAGVTQSGRSCSRSPPVERLNGPRIELLGEDLLGEGIALLFESVHVFVG